MKVQAGNEEMQGGETRPSVAMHKLHKTDIFQNCQKKICVAPYRWPRTEMTSGPHHSAVFLRCYIESSGSSSNCCSSSSPCKAVSYPETLLGLLLSHADNLKQKCSWTRSLPQLQSSHLSFVFSLLVKKNEEQWSGFTTFAVKLQNTFLCLLRTPAWSCCGWNGKKTSSCSYCLCRNLYIWIEICRTSSLHNRQKLLFHQMFV